MSTVLLLAILVLIALIGVSVVIFIVRLQTLLQVSVTDAYRGRVLGAYQTTQAALLLVGMAVSGALGGLIGPVHTLWLAGVLYASAGLVVAIILPRALQAPGGAHEVS